MNYYLLELYDRLYWERWRGSPSGTQTSPSVLPRGPFRRAFHRFLGKLGQLFRRAPRRRQSQEEKP